MDDLMLDFEKRLEETNDEYFHRLAENKLIYDITWTTIAELMNQETGNAFGESKYRKDWAMYKVGREDGIKIATSKNEELVDDYNSILLDIKKEKIKVQTERGELQKIIREAARVELYLEKIDEAIKEIAPLGIPEPILEDCSEFGEEALLVIGDAHYGSEFKIKGLMGETINEYSPEVFEERMWDLLQTVSSIIKKDNICKLHVVDVGDALDGLIHLSQITALRYGQTDAIIKYSEFMANWLNQLSRYCPVVFNNIKGNHSETRPFGTKRGEFPQENGERLVGHIIKIRTANNPRIVANETADTEAILINVGGFKNVIACHGQYEGQLEKIVSSYRDFYNINVDCVVMGHYHRNATKTVGSSDNGNIEIIQCPSIVGINKYAEGKKLSAKAGAKMIAFKYWGNQTYDIVLN